MESEVITGDIFEKLKDPDFVSDLIKFNSAAEIKEFLVGRDEKLTEREADELSSKIFSIISGLKKMDEKELEEVAGGFLVFNPLSALGFAAKGTVDAVSSNTELKSAEKVRDATREANQIEEEKNNQIGSGQRYILEANKKKFDVTYSLALAAMASLSALALLKIFKSAKQKKLD